jgi:hypothetical protein
MPKFKLKVARDIRMARSADLEVEAPNATEALARTRIALEDAKSDKDLAKAGIKLSVPVEAEVLHTSVTGVDSLGRPLKINDQKVADTIARIRAQLAKADKAEIRKPGTKKPA